MPQVTQNRRISQRVGKDLKKRSRQQKTGRQRITAAIPKAPVIIADSVFALTLKSMPSMEVRHIKGEGARLLEEGDNYEQMFEDIFLIVQNAVFLVTGEHTNFDPRKNGFDLSQSFDFILNVFKTNVLPDGWDFNVEKYHKDYKHGKYHLVMYTQCEFQQFWHLFQIGAVVETLAKKSKALHRMFVKFLHNFIHYTGIDTWWQGGLGYVDEYSILDQFENHEHDSEEDRKEKLAQLKETIACYKKGIAHKYKLLILQQPIEPITRLRKELNRFSKENKLVQWMFAACDFMEQDFEINDFIYLEWQDDDEGLMFDLQSAIIWNANDEYSLEHMEYLDAEQQGCGVFPPVLHLRLDYTTTDIDLKKLLSGLKWPQQLTKLLHKYNDAIKIFYE